MHSLSEKLEDLKNCPLFEKLNYDELKVIAMTASVIKCREGDVLFSEGDESSDVYVVFEGEAEAFTILPDGRNLMLATFRKSDVFGEFAVISNTPRTAGVRITKDFSGLKIPRELFFEFIRQFPEVSLKIMQILVNKLLTTQQRFMDLLSEGKYQPDGKFHV